MTVSEPTDDIPVTAQPMSAAAAAAGNANGTGGAGEPKRRVSIASDPVSDARHAYDNLGYDLHPRRKVSQVRLGMSARVSRI